jgi:hypothetical protein
MFDPWLCLGIARPRVTARSHHGNAVSLAGVHSLALMAVSPLAHQCLVRSLRRRPVRRAPEGLRAAGVVPRAPIQAHNSFATARRDARTQKALDQLHPASLTRVALSGCGCTCSRARASLRVKADDINMITTYFPVCNRPSMIPTRPTISTT